MEIILIYPMYYYRFVATDKSKGTQLYNISKLGEEFLFNRSSLL